MNALNKILKMSCLITSLMLLLACSGNESLSSEIYIPDSVKNGGGIKIPLSHTIQNDTTITIDIYRAGDDLGNVEIQIKVDEDSLNNRIKSAKSDLKANVYKYARLISSEYYEVSESIQMKEGDRYISLEMKINKNNLLEEWSGDTESYILPISISEVSNSNVNRRYGTTMVVFTRMHAPGVVIKHIPASQKLFAGSPSICIMPNGNYIASHDDNTTTSAINNNITQIYRSTDKGKTWTHRSQIIGQMWSSVFEYEGDLYIHGPDKVAGNLVIRKSTDEGETWTSPTSSTTGFILNRRISGAPTPVIQHNGRLWRAVEDAELSGGNSDGRWLYKAMMTSAPIGSDLLDASSWTISNTLDYNASYLGGKFGGWLEGNAVFDVEGNMRDIIRVDVPIGHDQYVASISVSSDGATMTFDPDNDFIPMTGGASKFAIRYDDESRKYYTLANYDYAGHTSIKPTQIRNTLVLMSSDDTRTWKINRVLLRHSDVRNVGFQYVDWQIDDDDIVFVSRTSYPDGLGGAMNYHNANYLTFHSIKEFRKTKDVDLDRESI